MELRQLHYFQMVAEELNFSRAAEKLNITQPPLSMQIQNLENEMGVKLFYRNRRSVELTDAGKAFLSEVGRIIQHIDRAVDITQRTYAGNLGKLTVGFVGSATYDILPEVTREYRRAYPEVELQLIELSTPNQVKALINKEIDIGFIRPPVTNEFLCTEIISKGACVLAVPKHHPLLKETKIDINCLSKYSFVLLARKTWAGLYDEIIGLFNPKIEQEALEFQTVIGLVAAGIGIAIVPKSTMHLHSRDVAYKELDHLLPIASMGIVWRKKYTSPLVKGFVKVANTCKQK
ncbi:LysR family transcriptional regulator [Peribacillus sp. NPDC058002]|uniref:LysR family transcriptional regulator n=1 Tax=Peribacillus sp. NPDC058002 TaxID=3346301 RepID=UPI0036DCDE9B